MSRSLSTQKLEEFQARLCDVAEAMFAERGAENVSMRQLADALGVSPMTPYRYFASREDILTAVRIRGFERFAAALETAYTTTPGDARARVMAAGQAYLDFAFANAHTYRLMFDVRQLDDTGETALGRAVARARATLSVYGDGLVERGVAEEDARAMENLIWSTLHGAASLELAGTLPPGSARQVLELWARSSGRPAGAE